MAAAAGPAWAWACLPEEILRRIAALLPPDARTAVAATCSQWRDALRPSRLWRTLDLSALGSAVTAQRAEALLRAASRRARGTLEELTLTGLTLPDSAVNAVLWANAGALRCVRLSGVSWLSHDDAQQMFGDAGGLRKLHADVQVWLPDEYEVDTVLDLVASGSLILRGLNLRSLAGTGEADEIANRAAALLRATSEHGRRIWLEDLHLEEATADARDNVVAALAECTGVEEVHLEACGAGAAVMVAIAPLGGLHTLIMRDEPSLLADAADYLALEATLRRTADTLKLLQLQRVCTGSSGALMRAVAASPLPALTKLQLCDNGAREEPQADEEQDRASDSYPDDDSSVCSADDAAVGAHAAADAEEVAACQLWPPFLTSAPLLGELSLPWLCRASVAPLLSSLHRRPLLTSVNLRLRDPTPAWLRRELVPGLHGRKFRLEVDAPTSSVSLRCDYETIMALEENPDEAKAAPPPRPAWDDWVRSRYRDETAEAGVRWCDFDETTEDGWKAYCAALKAEAERRRCALRPPPRRMQWQLGERDFAALPSAAWQLVWRALDVRSRIACMGVCRAWRAGFAHSDFWYSIKVPGATDSLLRALVPLCIGTRHFDASAAAALSQQAVRAFLWFAASAKMLEVQLPLEDEHSFYTLPDVASLARLVKSSQFCRIEADVVCADAARLVQLLDPVLPRSLRLYGSADDELSTVLRCMTAVCGTLGGRQSGRALMMRTIQTHWAPRKEEWSRRDRFKELDAALSRLAATSLQRFEAHTCRLIRRFVPMLCSLLRNGLQHLRLQHNPRLLRRSKHTPGGALQLADAIRAAPQLKELFLCDCGYASQTDVAAVVQACTGHATLTHLELGLCSSDGGHDDAESAAAVGAALAGLVVTSAPALKDIVLCGAVTAAQLTPLCDALRAGGHALHSVACEHEELNAALQAAFAAGRQVAPPRVG